MNIKKPNEYFGFDIIHENMLISFATALFMGIDSEQIHINYIDFMKAEDIFADKIFAEPPLLLKNVDLPKNMKK